MTSFRRLVLSIPEELSDELLVCLHEMGTTGVEIVDGCHHAYFGRGRGADGAHLLDGLRAAMGDSGGTLKLLSDEEIKDGLWAEKWMAALKPFEVANRFWIIPGSTDAPVADGLLSIRLTPGRAFGTGEHASTRMCLGLMSEPAARARTVLDVGTGSGILAIAARMSGAAMVVALDIDEDSVQVARRNIEINAASGILLLAGPLTAVRPAPWDLVLANISGATLLRLLPDLADHAAVDLILSGILVEEEQPLTDLAASLGLVLLGRMEEGGWVGLRLARRRGD